MKKINTISHFLQPALKTNGVKAWVLLGALSLFLSGRLSAATITVSSLSADAGADQVSAALVIAAILTAPQVGYLASASGLERMN